MSRLDELEDEVAKLKRLWKKYQTLRYYPHAMGLLQKPNQMQIQWLNSHTKGNWSVDQTCAPYNISFEIKSDLLMVKLSYPHSNLFCEKHQIL